MDGFTLAAADTCVTAVARHQYGVPARLAPKWESELLCSGRSAPPWTLPRPGSAYSCLLILLFRRKEDLGGENIAL
jgi:hypothetical protein